MAINVNEFSPTLDSLGRKGAMIDLSTTDATLGNAVKAVVVCAGGNVVYTPKNDASHQITMTSLTAGQALPHVPGTILKTGTTATLCTIED